MLLNVRFWFKKIFWKRELMKGIDIIRWDMVESSIEILFKQFELYYEKSRARDNYFDKEFLEELRLTCPRQYDETVEAYEINQYLIQRKKNWELFNMSLEEYVDLFRLSTNNEDVLNLEAELDYHKKFIFDGYTLKIELVEGCDTEISNCWDYTFAEHRLFQLDNEWAKRIIDLRGSLWD